MKKRLMKKLAYLIASEMFVAEMGTIKIILDGNGIEYTEDEAEEISEYVCDIFDKLEEKSEGWENLV